MSNGARRRCGGVPLAMTTPSPGDPAAGAATGCPTRSGTPPGSRWPRRSPGGWRPAAGAAGGCGV